MPADRHELAELLQQFATPHWQEAWSEFLDRFAPLILAICRQFDDHPERVDECFLYVCDQLVANRCRRLRRFRLDGPARFSTWLRAVVRNLCVDWRRRQIGRPRMFRSIAALSTQDQEIYRQVYEQGCTIAETVHSLQAFFPTLDHVEVAAALERIARRLTSRQIWLLTARRSRFESVAEDPCPEGAPGSVVLDPEPGPEALASLREERRLLSQALSGLTRQERLLVRLRFERGLSLDQVARMTGLENAQQADRRLQKVLRRLREEFGS